MIVIVIIYVNLFSFAPRAESNTDQFAVTAIFNGLACIPVKLCFISIVHCCHDRTLLISPAVVATSDRKYNSRVYFMYMEVLLQKFM